MTRPAGFVPHLNQSDSAPAMRINLEQGDTPICTTDSAFSARCGTGRSEAQTVHRPWGPDATSSANRSGGLALTLGGIDIAVAHTGSGPPLLLVHGSASSSAQWRDVAAALAGRFSVIGPDLYGCGGTGAWPGWGPMRLAEHVRLIERVLEHETQPVHIVGHSFGGAVALRFALEFPERIASLILIEPVAFHLLRQGLATDCKLYAEIRGLAASIFHDAVGGRREAGMARFVDYWNGHGAWEGLPPPSRARLAAQTHNVAMHFTALFAETADSLQYRRLSARTLVIRGSESPRPARRVAEIVAEAIPKATIETVLGAGHMLPLTHAGTVLAMMRDFLDQTRTICAAA